MNIDCSKYGLVALKRTMENDRPTKRTKTEFDFEEFERKIDQSTDQTGKAAVIASVYRKHFDKIVSIWPEYASADFIDWLNFNSRHMGSPYVDHLHHMITMFTPNLANSAFRLRRFDQFMEAMKAFFADLQQEWSVATANQNQRTTEKVEEVAHFHGLLSRGKENSSKIVAYKSLN